VNFTYIRMHGATMKIGVMFPYIKHCRYCDA